LGVRFPPGLPTFAHACDDSRERRWPARRRWSTAARRAKVDVSDEKLNSDVMATNEPTKLDAVREGVGGRLERARLFLSEVRNELKRVTWPTQKEVYATTVVVILTSVFFGIYLFLIDTLFFNSVQWILRRFGAA